MVVINQKNDINPGENNSPEIYLNSNLRRWFSRNIGCWKSNRTYFLEDVRIRMYGNHTINSLGTQKKNILFLMKILISKNVVK